MKEREPLYASTDLVALFQGLADDGYEALSMGLIKDLIELECKDTTEGKEIQWQVST